MQEEIYRKNKRIIVSGIYKKNSTPIKFTYTNNVLKKMPREKTTLSSYESSMVKKAIQNTIDRYLRFKRNHSNVIQSAPAKKVKQELIPEPPKRAS